MSCVKVTIVHNTIAPYRHPLFEQLSKTVDLMVYYCSIRHSSRKWDLWPRNYNYKWKILPRIPIRTPIGGLLFNPTIVEEIIKDRPHVIIIGGYVDPTMWLTFIMSKILKIPVVYWTEGIKEPKSILGMIIRPLRMLFVKKASAVVVPGKLSRSYVISLGANAEKVFIAPNTIDNELFVKTSDKYRRHKNQLKNQLGFRDKVIILCVAQLIERKGIKYLLQAYSKIEQEYKNVALLICGSGPLKTSLKELANKLEIQNFKIVKSGLSLEQLVKLYSASDIFVLPTLEDVWGFVINEAMACGLPVVSTKNAQAALEMIRDGENGYIIKVPDSDQLYYALKSLIQNSTLRREMGEKSRKIVVKEFSVSAMVEGFLSAIEYCSRFTKK